jgi:hypothetical protein
MDWGDAEKNKQEGEITKIFKVNSIIPPVPLPINNEWSLKIR